MNEKIIEDYINLATERCLDGVTIVMLRNFLVKALAKKDKQAREEKLKLIECVKDRQFPLGERQWCVICEENILKEQKKLLNL